MSDIMTDLQLKEIKLNELQNSQSTNSHSRNDRVEDKLILLERQLEEQRRKILHLESIPRMTKAELNTPDKEVNRKLEFQESAQSSHSHSHNANVGNPTDSNDPNQGQQPAPPSSHSGNDKGGTGCAELRETVRRLTFWIKQITGVMDLGENPDDVSFPNWQTCRQLSKLKNEIEALQQKCKECHSKIPGGDQSQLEKNVEALKKGLNGTMGRLDQFLSHQKRDHAQVQELQRGLGLMRDELAAWAVYFQQQEPGNSGSPEKSAEPEQSPMIPVTVLTAMASQGDVEIEVTDPDRYPIGKYIVIQESFIYMVEGKGSLILDRPLCRDFLVGTTVRPLSDEDQYRWEDGEIILCNPQPSHSNNGEHGNSTNPHGQNGNMGTPNHIELNGLDRNSHSGMGNLRTQIHRMSSFHVGSPNLLLRGQGHQ